MSWFTWSPLELWANLTTVLCIWLAGRNSVHTWWTGIVSCILFGVLFFQSQLYADVTLQLFFIATGFIGWRGWVNKKNEAALPLEHAGARTIWTMTGISLIVVVLYGLLLKHFTNAFSPFVDSTVMAVSVAAQLLLMRRKTENWPAWVIVNAISTPLYISRGLYLTGALYALFFVHALWAWYYWIRLEKAKEQNPLHEFMGLA